LYICINVMPVCARRESIVQLDPEPYPTASQACCKYRMGGGGGWRPKISGLTFTNFMQEHGAKHLIRERATILQLNIGLYCNQACSHCHVESSPLRTEMMDRPTAQRCVDLLKAPGCNIRTVDITGGAPELNSEFRYSASRAPEVDVDVIANLIAFQPTE